MEAVQSMAADNVAKKEFRFLSGTESKYNKEVRAFVLRGYNLKRKQKAQAKKIGNCNLSFEFCEETAHGSSSKKVSERGAQKNVTKTPEAHHAPINLTLGQGRADPFGVYACRTSPTENFFLDQYVGDAMRPFGFARKNSFHPPRDVIFELTMQDEALICVTVSWGAASLMARNHVSWPALDCVNYRNRAILLINQKMRAQLEHPSDALLLSILGIVSTTLEASHDIPDAVGSEEVPMHIKGLRALLAVRGGWQALPSCHHALQWTFRWIDIVVDGALSAGWTAPSSHLPWAECLLESLRASANSAEPGDTDWYSEELIGAYTDFYHLAKARRISSQRQVADPLLSSPSPTDLFQVGTPAYETLRQSKRVAIRPITSRLFVNIMLFNYRDYPASLLKTLHDYYDNSMKKCDVHLTYGNEMLFWALTTNVETKRWHHPSWVELLCRLLHVVSRLTEPTQQRLTETMLAFIAVDDVQGGPEELWWTPAQFQEIIHQELSRSDEAGQDLEHGLGL